MTTQQKKTVSKKATGAKKPVGASAQTKASKATCSYKPGSLLGRRGGMVPTVELGKRAASQIS